MPKSFKSISKNKGLSPGTVIYIGEEKTAEVKISVIDYNEDEFVKREGVTAEDCFPFKDKDSITWINVDGVHNTASPLHYSHITHPPQPPGELFRTVTAKDKMGV